MEPEKPFSLPIDLIMAYYYGMSKAIKNMVSYNFHVPLPESLYKILRDEAERAKQPATKLAREAISEFLERRRKYLLHEEIAVYAKAHSGHSDLDKDLEQASVDFLVDNKNDE